MQQLGGRRKLEVDGGDAFSEHLDQD